MPRKKKLCGSFGFLLLGTISSSPGPGIYRSTGHGNCQDKRDNGMSALEIKKIFYACFLTIFFIRYAKKE